MLWSSVIGIFLALLGGAMSVPIKMADNILDMSYAYVNRTMPYFPGNKIFTIYPRFVGMNEPDKRFFISKYEFETAEHGGTHYDAPTHFCNTPSCWFPQDIPIDRFVGEACVVDVREKAAVSSNYGLSVQDLVDYESKYGKIPEGAYVIMYSGWGQYFENKTAYMGDPTDQSKMAWPSFHESATKWLVDERDIKGIGVDSLSIDVPNSTARMTHRLAMGRNKIGLENLANVDKLPARGATIFAFPMNIKGGSGGPARVVAMWNNGGTKSTPFNTTRVILLAVFTMITMLK